MIPEAVYTGIVALLIYKILLEVDIRIRDGEKGVCSSVTKIYEKAEKLLANRLLALIILIVVLYCVLIGRVFVLQIVEGQSHKMIYI